MKIASYMALSVFNGGNCPWHPRVYMQQSSVFVSSLASSCFSEMSVDL